MGDPLPLRRIKLSDVDRDPRRRKLDHADVDDARRNCIAVTAMMDDLLEVETSAAAVRGASITFHQRVLRGDKALVTASVLAASIRNDRPARIPADLRRRLQPPV